MKILGLDIGDRRIGVAIVDTQVDIPSPLLTLRHNRLFVNELKKLVSQHDIKKLIVGLPLTLAGHEGEQASRVKEVVEKIKTKLDLPVILEDERLTSHTAAHRLRMVEHTRADIDAVSAAVILENWLARGR
ncbi:MAG: Holliday junction resolvase RuvX [Patescibacteria group bacterium]|nr:Holliday junction resolvase RuvX [Patescibacteria group bacterium]